jgi:hypothetical protein
MTDDKKHKIKIRKQWKINPVTKIHADKKDKEEGTKVEQELWDDIETQIIEELELDDFEGNVR